MNREALTRPFPHELLRQRQGHNGKSLTYVETWAVIDRLNEACDAWSFEVVEHQILGDELIVVGRLSADGVVKMAFGGSSLTRDRNGNSLSVADDLKSAASDALKKAASLLGVGLELYRGSQPEPAPATTARVPSARRPDFGDRLTASQLGALHSAARRTGLGNDGLAQLVRDRFEKEGPQHLSKREASTILDELNGARREAAH